ncbi:energy-coupling factor transporter transmembrane component T [Anaerotignum sp. MB30-C6]|uniref:energy-coupling factor transporter transmembrane component T n=1 Tax=Anaerotignum sp. MB30-C6 TaxID=3070814 RepID=UPI0027DBDEA2|nr:energy-coupling factor transporter transmembrane component T [Anaerotignum sp. MB30-C6]WMI79900.1 energy-coupling factor transporter transmembrane component T [Anaerotignum sp. MB30-C6]
METDKTPFYIIDPRTKLLILALNSVFVFGGAGGADTTMEILRHVITFIPLGLLFFGGKRKPVLLAAIFYVAFHVLQVTLFEHTKGVLNYILLFSIGVFVRILPNIMSGYYFISTTRVSELVGAMEKMHLTDKLIIPIAVMMRFFPVAMEEAGAVHDAMGMRGIRFGGRHPSKILEYRLIPMITCSVKTGEELSASALARGLGSPIKRTNICSIGFRALDYAFWILGVFTVFVFITTLL